MVGMTLLKLQVCGKWPKVSTQWVLFFSILISVREVGGSGNTDLHLAEWQQSVGDELPAPLQGAMCLLQLFPLWFPYTTAPIHLHHLPIFLGIGVCNPSSAEAVLPICLYLFKFQSSFSSSQMSTPLFSKTLMWLLPLEMWCFLNFFCSMHCTQ